MEAIAPPIDATKFSKNVALEKSSRPKPYSLTAADAPKSANDPGAFYGINKKKTTLAAVHEAPLYSPHPSDFMICIKLCFSN
jgi:hypothetical protein